MVQSVSVALQVLPVVQKNADSQSVTAVVPKKRIQDVVAITPIQINNHLISNKFLLGGRLIAGPVAFGVLNKRMLQGF